jgi:hypothetical protein
MRSGSATGFVTAGGVPVGGAAEDGAGASPAGGAGAGVVVVPGVSPAAGGAGATAPSTTSPVGPRITMLLERSGMVSGPLRPQPAASPIAAAATATLYVERFTCVARAGP